MAAKLNFKHGEGDVKPTDSRGKSAARKKRKLDAVADTLDFRDRMYEPSLVEVPATRPLAKYLKYEVPVLDQGEEGACTGFALATVANFLLRQKGIRRGDESVSPQMLFDLARRYDEWPGTDYDWSSARGAMKAWHKHGVCSLKHWEVGQFPPITDKLARDAATRPLGAYCRVNHRDLVSMHAALTEVGVLYVTSDVHAGWDDPQRGIIERQDFITGGHAFAIVGYDRSGFWIQNSWGEDWGRKGFAHLSYDDWLANGNDAWVARLGVPVELTGGRAREGTARAAAAQSPAVDFAALRPFIISTGNDGQLHTSGQFGTNEKDVAAIILDDFVRASAKWSTRRLMFFAHGGLNSEDIAIDRVRKLHKRFLDHEIYPVFFSWNSDFFSTLKNIFEDAMSRKRPAAGISGAKDFLLDRMDDFLEPFARRLTGRAEWSEMKENAIRASTTPKGGARIAATFVRELVARGEKVEIHLAGHSAGAVYAGAFAELLAEFGLPIASTTLFAPACTMEFFRRTYVPLITSKAIGRFSVFTLTDRFEQDDDCVRIYNKSLLYLVSNALEDETFRVPVFRPEGEKLAGMQRFIQPEVEKDPAMGAIFNPNDWILAPNDEPAGSEKASRATKHGGFADDDVTVSALMARIVSAAQINAPSMAAFPLTPEALRNVRLTINAV
jgi:hypothetical protein